MRRLISAVPLLLVLVGLALFVFWGGAILPLLGLGLGPAPGHELLAFLLAFALPALASLLLLAGGASGLRRRYAAGAGAASVGSVAYVLVVLLGCCAAAYTVLIVKALL